MDRRSFLRSAAVAPIVAASMSSLPAHSAPVGYERVSCEKGDPGEVAFATAKANGKDIRVTLDGVETKYCVTADANEGWIRRYRATPDDKMLINPVTGDILTEVIHGVVEISLL